MHFHKGEIAQNMETDSTGIKRSRSRRSGCRHQLSRSDLCGLHQPQNRRGTSRGVGTSHTGGADAASHTGQEASIPACLWTRRRGRSTSTPSKRWTEKDPECTGSHATDRAGQRRKESGGRAKRRRHKLGLVCEAKERDPAPGEGLGLPGGARGRGAGGQEGDGGRLGEDWHRSRGPGGLTWDLSCLPQVPEDWTQCPEG